MANGAETFTSGAPPLRSGTPTRERQVSAVFAEARVPLVGPANARLGVQALDVSFAARAETYDDIGSTANPKLGVLWTPSDEADPVQFGLSD